MMLKDEYNRLLTLFHDATEGKPVNLEEVFKESVAFFGLLKDQITIGSPEDRQMAMKMMADLYSQMIAVTKKLCDRSGMTEEQLMAFADNPANFTDHQWKAIQASREKLTKVGRDLAETVESTLTPEERAGGKQKRTKEIKGKKSKWMRS